ncbi:MAG: saccharopine dehydrogenase, partial [Myxococcales bacterium]|nr:saccharopine dehydrogenase [Myxococcales bacterium]
MPLVLACAENGTDYCDTTGEVHFMRRSIDAADARAKATGARIVHAVGFDSIPSDLGVFLLAEHAQKRGRTLGETELVLTSSKGGASGGTIATMLAMVDEAKKDLALRKMM